MKNWIVRLTTKSYKQLKKLPIYIQDIVEEAISDLEIFGPTPEYWDTRKTGDGEYRIRLNYRYRMRYTVVADCLAIEIFYLGHRKNAY